MNNYDFKEIEPEIRKYWRKINLLKLLQRKNKNGKSYFLLEGPPYANNVLHVGHLRNIFYKDLNQRYQFMRGRAVIFTAGFDTHGLPIENMVEKKLGFTRKKDIVDFGINNFTKECKKLADLNVKNQMKVYEDYGAWMGWDDNPYLTYNNEFLESGWWTFKEMYKNNQVYKGKKSIHWCPHCETALAGAEVEQEEKTDPGIYIKFELTDEDTYLLVFTTTPWTLPANVSIAVAPKGDYVKVKTQKGNLILAEERLELLERIGVGYKILEKFKGEKLAGKSYEPILNTPTQKSISKHPKARRIHMSIPILKERIAPKTAEKKGIKSKDIFEEFVSTKEGTGLVHSAPGHGKTDNEFGKHYHLPTLSPVDDAGKFTEEAGKYGGTFVKEADHDIMKDLQDEGKLLHSEKVQHSYPICWRCKSPLIFRLSNQWFFKTDKIRKKLLSENQRVNWKPEFARERMAKWLVNYDDWNFSRQRFWGIPIPLWECNSCENKVAVSSKKELEKHLKKKLAKDYDLHNAVEQKFKCKNCPGTMNKIPDIFDVWYDSGIVPWAWIGAPLKNKKQFEKYFPVDRVSESLDQISGWFTSLLYTSVSVFGKAPCKEISMPAFAVDSKGEKMSKSVGNVVWAKEGIENLGADLIRLYYTSNVPPYDLAKFNINEVRKETFSTINALWNLHNYLGQEFPIVTSKRIYALEDKWILSRLNSTIQTYHIAFQNFEYQEIGRALSEFIVNDLSRTYIQLVRERIEEKDSTVGFILLKCITDVLKLLAPISPFVADKIYLNLKNYSTINQKSIHLERLPTAPASSINKKLEEEFALIRDTISDTLAIRDQIKRNLRWPIKELMVVSPSKKVISTVKKYSNLIQKQTNTLNIKTRQELKGIKYTVKLNFREVGKTHSTLTNKIAGALSKLSNTKIIQSLEKGNIKLKVGGKTIVLKEKDIIVTRELPEKLHGISRQKYILYIDPSETENMIARGLSREITRKIQDMRKSLKLNKSQKINIELVPPFEYNINPEEIKNKTNAIKISIVDKISFEKKEVLRLRGKIYALGIHKN